MDSDAPTNTEQLEALTEVEEEHQLNKNRYIFVTENVQSSTDHNLAGVKVLEAKARYWRILGSSLRIVVLAGVVAVLVMVIQ